MLKFKTFTQPDTLDDAFKLNHYSQMDNVDFVDTYNYPEAEQTALSRNISVSYIAVPEKPDNSH